MACASRSAGLLSRLLQKLRLCGFILHIGKAHRKPYIGTKLQYTAHLLPRLFHYQLHQRAKHHLAAMILFVEPRDKGKSFLNGVRRRFQSPRWTNRCFPPQWFPTTHDTPRIPRLLLLPFPIKYFFCISGQTQYNICNFTGYAINYLPHSSG